MSWQSTVLVTPTAFAAVIALLLVGYVAVQIIRGRSDPNVVLFLLITVSTIIWTGFSALKLLQTDLDTKLLFFRLLHIGAAALPPLFFLFVATYTDRTRWLRPELIGSLFIVPTAFIVLLFVDPGNLIVGESELITDGMAVLRVSSGPGFLIFLLYSTALIIASIGLVLSEAQRIGSTYYSQAALITLALLLPIIVSILTEAGVQPFTDERINFVPASASVSITAFAVLLGRYRLFDLPPLAYATGMKYSPDGILVLDREEHIVHANETGQKLLDQLKIQSGEVLSRYLDEFSPGKASGKLIKIPSDDDEPSYQRLLVKPLERGERRVGWVVIFRDETTQQQQQRQLQREIDERKTYEQTLERQRDNLEVLNQVVRHDVRNDLQLVTGYAERLADTCETDEAKDQITTIAESAEHAVELTETAREIADVLLSDLDELRQINLETALETEISEVQSSYPESVITYETPIPSVRVTANEMLSSVFSNLLKNAIQHNDKDVAEVTISATERDGTVRVRIADNGPGVPDTHKETIFGKGEKGLESAGTGMGLYLVETLVTNYNGEVWVEDNEPVGSVFVVELPITE